MSSLFSLGKSHSLLTAFSLPLTWGRCCNLHAICSVHLHKSLFACRVYRLWFLRHIASRLNQPVKVLSLVKALHQLEQGLNNRVNIAATLPASYYLSLLQPCSRTLDCSLMSPSNMMLTFCL